jgi:formylglycine-generating enzyme required for sulfatase activity
MEFILIKGGCFEMGDIWGNSDEGDMMVHEGCVDDVRLEKYELTQARWKSIL